MKVLLIDLLNIQNNFYIVTKFLRRKGIEADLLFASNIPIPKMALPSWHDPAVKSEKQYPDWIKTKEWPLNYHRVFWDFRKKQAPLVKFLQNYDLILCSGLAPILVSQAKRLFIFCSYGSDLDQVARYGWSGNPLGFRRSWKTKIDHFLLAYRMRKSIRKAAVVMLSPYQIPIAKQLGLKSLRFFPHVIDTDLFIPMDDIQQKKAKEKARQNLNGDLILFSPARQVWKNPSLTDCKGNDKVFKGFAKFLDKTKQNAKLIVIEKGWDLIHSKKLIKELGIEPQVIWKEPMRREEMVWYYNTADIVLDQFSWGILALPAVEAMACGITTFSYITPGPSGLFYPEMPPLVNVKTEDEICDKLCELAKDESERKKIGQRCHEWVMKYCQGEVAIERFITLFKEIITQ